MPAIATAKRTYKNPTNGRGYKRTKLERRIDDDGEMSPLLEEYIEYRKNFRTETQALELALNQDRGNIYLLRRRANDGQEPFVTFFREIKRMEREMNLTDRDELIVEAKGNAPVKLQLYRMKYRYANQENVNAQAIELAVLEGVQTILVQVIAMFSTTLQARAKGKSKVEIMEETETLVELFNTAQEKQVEENELNVIEA